MSPRHRQIACVFGLLLALGASAKTSVGTTAPTELPCPSNRTESPESAPGALPLPSPGMTDPAIKPGNRASRQRWKALLPGSIKAIT